jgi:hypothetical protein
MKIHGDLHTLRVQVIYLLANNPTATEKYLGEREDQTFIEVNRNTCKKIRVAGAIRPTLYSAALSVVPLTMHIEARGWDLYIDSKFQILQSVSS